MELTIHGDLGRLIFYKYGESSQRKMIAYLSWITHKSLRGKLEDSPTAVLPCGRWPLGLSFFLQITPHPSFSKPYVQKYVVKNYFYYYLFRFSAALGQEVFYITFLPFTHWNIDPFLSRRLIIVWVLVMYIGQVAKDILKWPRPLSPPVVKLEKRVIAEYGMPSTHAMNSAALAFEACGVDPSVCVSTQGVPVFLTCGDLAKSGLSPARLRYPFVLGLLMAVLFSTLVCLSRLYTGMHTVLICARISGGSDDSHGEEGQQRQRVHSKSHQHQEIPATFTPGGKVTLPAFPCPGLRLPPLPPRLPPWLSALAAGLALSLTKFAVGIALVLAVRRLVQALSLQVLCSWFRVVPRDREARRRLEIEVPYKFVTYVSVGICATTFVPMLHRFLGLP
eukprot:XP_022270856.1 sphingosine-1-phosphate phosphatase 2 [Canis lupus familiaris]